MARPVYAGRRAGLLPAVAARKRLRPTTGGICCLRQFEPAEADKLPQHSCGAFLLIHPPGLARWCGRVRNTFPCQNLGKGGVIGMANPRNASKSETCSSWRKPGVSENILVWPVRNATLIKGAVFPAWPTLSKGQTGVENRKKSGGTPGKRNRIVVIPT